MEGQDFCMRVGQSWRATTLEGWRLYHDPNFVTVIVGVREMLSVKGNKYRNVLKYVAGTTQDSALSKQETAVNAALCGNPGQLQPVCTSC